jgi:streptogramin lyase
MSDFLTELRREVYEAHARNRRRGSVGRALGRGYARRPSRRALAPALAVLAAVAVAVIAVRLLPAAKPAGPGPRVTATLRIGGTPVAGAVGYDSLWIADATGSVVRVDLGLRRVVARIPVGGGPDSITVGSGAVWCRLEQGSGTELVRIDPRTNRVTTRSRAGGGALGSPSIAAGSGALWLARDFPSAPSVDRVDTTGLTVTARIRGFSVPKTIVAAGGTVWAVVDNGTLLRIDPRAHVVGRWPGLVPSVAGGALAADAGGVWAISTGRAAIVRLSERGIDRRIRIPDGARAFLARTADGLWLSFGGGFSTHNMLVRVDPATGQITATVDIGAQTPTALLPVAGHLGVVTGNGKVLLVR